MTEQHTPQQLISFLLNYLMDSEGYPNNDDIARLLTGLGFTAADISALHLDID